MSAFYYYIEVVTVFFMSILVILANAGNYLNKEDKSTAMAISRNMNELDRKDLNELLRMEFISFMLQIRSRNVHIRNTLFNMN